MGIDQNFLEGSKNKPEYSPDAIISVLAQIAGFAARQKSE
jgi:hypothetical protein